MSRINNVQLGLDATQAARASRALTEALGRINAGLSNVSNALQDFDAKGNLVRATLKGITNDGAKFTAVMTDFSSLFPEVDKLTRSFSKLDTSQEDLKKSTKEAADAERAFTTELEHNLKQTVANRKAAEKLNQQRQRALALARREAEASGKSNKSAADKLNDQRQRALRAIERDETRRNAANRRAAEQLNQQRQRALAALARDETRRNEANRRAAEQLNQQRQRALANIARGEERINNSNRRAADQLNAQRQRALAAAARAEERRNAANRRAADQLNAQRQRALAAQARANRPDNEALISWRSFGRLFIVQALHQSIALVRTELAQAAEEAKEFSRVVGSIRTISEDADNSTKLWTESLNQLGVGLPFKQLDLAKAAYQALSDQIIHTADDLDFLREASRLAIVGVSDIQTSVDALSSIINAFDFSLLRTQSISATLFATVDLGRSSLEELGKNIGRVSIVANQLGVSFESQQAALATLSIQGLKDNVAKTLLLNVYNKLLRPSERMREILDEQGFSSGQAAIAALGLGGVLELLRKEARKTGDEVQDMAEIYQRLRSVSGALGLDTEKLAETLKESGEITQDFASDYQKSLESTANQLDIELANLNRLLLQFGQQVNEAILAVARAFGGLDDAVGTFGLAIFELAAIFVGTRIVAVVRSLSAALLAFRTSALIAGIAAFELAAIWSVVWPVAIVAAVASLAYLVAQTFFFRDSVEQAVEDSLKAFDDLAARIGVGVGEALQQVLKESDRVFGDIKRAVALLVSDVQKLLNLMAVDFEDAFDQATDAVARLGESSVENLTDKIRDLNDELRDAERNAEDAEKALDKAAQAQDKLLVDIREREIIQQNQGKPKGLLATDFLNEGLATGNVDFLEKAQNILEQIRDDENNTFADRQQAEQLAAQAEQEIIRLKRIELALERQAAIDASDALIDEQAKAIALEEQIKAREVALAVAEKSAKLLADFDLNERRKELEKTLAPDKSGDDGLAEKLDDSNFIEDTLLRELQTLQQQAEIDAQNAGLPIQEMLAQQREFEEAKAEIQAAFRAENRQLELTDLKINLTNQLELIQKEKKKQEDALDKARKNSAKVIRNAVSDRKILEESIEILIASVPQELRSRLRAGIGKDLERLAGLDSQFQAESSQLDPNQDVLNKILEERARILGVIQERFKGSDFSDFTVDGRSLGNVIGDLSVSTTVLQDSAEVQRDAMDELNDATKQLAALREDLIKNNLLDPVAEATQENTFTMKQLIQALSDNIFALRDLRDTIINELDNPPPVPQQPAPPTPDQLASGGLVYGRGGIDTIAANLTRGEYVVNAQATRAFLPILTAINRGYVNGGRVQNVNFGDINVSGGNTNQETARSLVRHIKHEMKRGTLTL